MAISWKAFDFFEVSQIRLGDDETRSLFEGNEISSVCSGSDSLFLGSYDGWVRIVGASWKVVRSFQAHDIGSITHMRQVDGTSLLVTVAEDLSTEPTLKVWALDRPVKKTGLPTCLSSVAVNNGKKQFPISAFAALDDLSQLAFGFANGAVTVLRGDLIHDKGTKQRIIYESEEPITGVELRFDAKLTTLFVSTTSRVLKLVILGKGQGQPPKTVEDAGCGVGCMTVDERTGEIVIARDDAIYYYTIDGRGPPRAYEAPKSLISVYETYVAVVSPPSIAPAADSDAMRRRFGVNADPLFTASTFTLLETDLRLIAHSESLITQVKAIFQIWGDLFTLTQDGKIFRYHERSLPQRLELLYQRNMFSLAIELAQKSGMDAQKQNVIFRKFGDYLYQKGDYDGAMTQYIKAIDSTEPSQVIRKFLDTQRIHNLIEYLEELHEHHKATADHTTLLLNCYAKLKDIDKLEKFIKSPGDLKFDLDTAISMCRQGGYYEQAAYLAQKHGETDLVVDILIEDSKNYAEALDYIWHLEPEVAYPSLMKYARVLLENCPKEATQIFIDYYTGKYRPRVTVVAAEEAPTPTAGGFAAGAASAVQNLTSLLPLPYMNSSSVATPTSDGARNNSTAAAVIENLDDLEPPNYTPPKPRTAFSSFIDHPDEFIVFLEACLKDDSLSDADKADINTTLFEMYLHKANEKRSDHEREEWEAKAKVLISLRSPSSDQSDPSQSAISNSNVLLLSHLSSFRAGTLLVKEQAGLLFDIFRSYTSARDTRGAMRALRKYGPDEPGLYPAALAYLASDARVLDEAGLDELSNILKKIDSLGLMAPLQVVQTLGAGGAAAMAISSSSTANGDGKVGGGGATMGMIKPYLAETIERERKEIAANRRRAAAFRRETEARRSELAELNAKPAVFQATRCADCGLQLDLPAVHFLCRHSFHARCVRPAPAAVAGGGAGDEARGAAAAGGGGGQVECPKCAPENATIRALRRQQDDDANRQDLFKYELENKEDRFATVAAWFGRGVMDMPPPGME